MDMLSTCDTDYVMIYVIGPRDKTPDGAVVINTTSKVKSIFSPFYNPTKNSRTMENDWQFSKVYEEHDDNGKPSKEWFEWRNKGLKSKWAERYPMGKGRVPIYSWNDKPLTYIEARKELYIPLYRESISTQKHNEEIDLILWMLQHDDIALWDYDGYLTEDSFETIVNNPDKKMGHAFVLREVMKERVSL